MINVRLLLGYNNMKDENKIAIYLIKIFCLFHHFLLRNNCKNNYENIMKIEKYDPILGGFRKFITGRPLTARYVHI